VEVFGYQSHGDIIAIGSPVIGQVQCLWERDDSPPTTCPFFERTDDGGFNQQAMAFTTAPTKHVNCAREGGIGARHCWYPATIRSGPDLSDQYDTEEGELGVPWNKLYNDGSACNRGGIHCSSQTQDCAALLTGGKPKMPASNFSVCQRKFCDPETFAAGCCESI
jgi:hypothetical protein